MPIGPIPFTLQMFAITFAIVVLSPKEAIAAITGYLLAMAVKMTPATISTPKLRRKAPARWALVRAAFSARVSRASLPLNPRANAS